MRATIVQVPPDPSPQGPPVRDNSGKESNAVDDRTSILLSAMAGAVAGACVGYLFFTEEGRQLREDLEPRLADLVAELGKARTIVKGATNAVADVRLFGR
jgi:hypothetical protein